MRKAQNPAGLTEKRVLVNGRTVRVTTILYNRIAEHSAESNPYTHFAYLTSNTDCQRWCGYTDSGCNFRGFCSSSTPNLVETCQPQPHFHNKEV